MDARELWDRAAATFDDEPDHGLADPATRAAWRDLLLAVLPPAPARVADLGCGTGTLSVLLAGEGYDVHGVDVAAPELDPTAYDVVLCRHVPEAVYWGKEIADERYLVVSRS